MISDLLTVLFLVFLEGALSIDNAIVLAMLVRHLPKNQQCKALSYGIWGAWGFRFLSLFILNYLMKSVWLKYAGGYYLLYIAYKGFFNKEDDDSVEAKGGSFIRTIITVELMDITFSADSIMAAVAVSPKFWIVFTGGVLGIVMMRFAANLFIKLLENFPALETTANLLVMTIGFKLIFEGAGVDFHSGIPFYGFWGLMAGFLGYGFLRKNIAT